MVPTCIAALHFDNASIMPVAGGSSHCALVTDRGGLYTWGKAPSLGRTGKKAQVLPTHIVPLLLQVSRVRCYNHVLPTHAKGTHSRLHSRAAPTVAQETATVASGDSNQRRSQRRQRSSQQHSERQYHESEGVNMKVQALGLFPHELKSDSEGFFYTRISFDNWDASPFLYYPPLLPASSIVSYSVCRPCFPSVSFSPPPIAVCASHVFSLSSSSCLSNRPVFCAMSFPN